MCLMPRPKIVKAAEPPPPPPEPTLVAMDKKPKSKKPKKKGAGISKLVSRRLAVNVGSRSTGSNVNYS